MRLPAAAALALLLLAGCTTPSGPTVADPPEGYVLQPVTELDARKGKTNPAFFPRESADPQENDADTLASLGGGGLPTPTAFATYTYIAESTLGGSLLDDQRIVVVRVEFDTSADADTWAAGFAERRLEREGSCLGALLFSDGAQAVVVIPEPGVRDGGARAAGDALRHFERLRAAAGGDAACEGERMDEAHALVARYTVLEKPHVDDHEPNDTMAQATMYGQALYGVTGSLPAGDVDWFGFNLTDATPTLFHVAGAVRVQVATADGTVVGEDTATVAGSGSTPTAEVCILVEPGVHHVRVEATADPVVEFMVSVSSRGGCTP